MSENQTSENTSASGVGSKDLLGAMYQGSDGAMTCALCNCEMEWGECADCGGEGGHDGYEEDPNWYQPGEISPCGMCSGQGGQWYCETDSCPTGSGWKVIRPPQAPNADIRDRR